MSILHILSFSETALPWWATHQRFPNAPTTLLTDCCCCRMRRSDTVARTVVPWMPPLGGMGCYQEPALGFEKGNGPWAEPSYPTAAFYESRIEVKCAPDKGCNKNPRRRFGKTLREMWRYL
jgi:hypothetical protein